ncbi:MAG TPA: hypothetical protein VHT24_16760 [Pseudacidobacterium sp.]|jgi:hypothetical protein|nr:hypothetical protein [Pseudacidobacterium sp.]
MTTLSPADALGPAFRRAREVMLAPKRLGFFLKIALVAALTQPSFYSVTISYPMQGVQAGAGAAMRHASSSIAPASNFSSGIGAVAGGITFAVLAAFLLIGLLFSILILYVLCRLRFALFDLVVYKHGKVREAWAKYGKQTLRYFGVVLLASLAFLVVAAVTAAPFFVRIIKTANVLGLQGQNANPWPLLAQMLPLLGVIFLLALAWAVVDAVVQDFVLPSMAIEDASIEGAFGRFFTLLRTDTGSVLVYLLLRFVVALGISWVLMMVVLVALLMLGLGGVAVGAGLFHVMWQGGAGMQIVFVMIVAAMAIVLLALYFVASISVYGTVAVFKQSYAAYFFGSRYTELGNRLEPPDEDMVTVVVEPPLPPLPPLQEPPPIW